MRYSLWMIWFNGLLSWGSFLRRQTLVWKLTRQVGKWSCLRWYFRLWFLSVLARFFQDGFPLIEWGKLKKSQIPGEGGPDQYLFQVFLKMNTGLQYHCVVLNRYPMFAYFGYRHVYSNIQIHIFVKVISTFFWQTHSYLHISCSIYACALVVATHMHTHVALYYVFIWFYMCKQAMCTL